MYGEKAASWHSDENGNMMIVMTCLVALCMSICAAFVIPKRSLLAATLGVIIIVIILFRLASAILQ